jgi:lipoprotein-anchoring transpeptidase ErfK/SrfK
MIRLIGTAVAIASLVASLSQAQASDVNRQIYISKSDQTLRLYEDGALVNAMRISTGKVKHETPSGIFSIIEKKKYHESNIYSNAPMPFMQRVTWSGIALHEGRVPDYPASHGCIRIPKKWAPELYRLTKRGTPVIITNEPVKPFRRL